jgi:hypothetical protein
VYFHYFRRRQWAVGYRYAGGGIHFVAAYPSLEEAKAAAARMNGGFGERCGYGHR